MKDDFFNDVVVSSGKTAVDTDKLLMSVRAMHQRHDTLVAAQNYLYEALGQLTVATALGPFAATEGAAAMQALNTACETVGTLSRDIGQQAEALENALFVLGSADADGATFYGWMAEFRPEEVAGALGPPFGFVPKSTPKYEGTRTQFTVAGAARALRGLHGGPPPGEKNLPGNEDVRWTAQGAGGGLRGILGSGAGSDRGGSVYVRTTVIDRETGKEKVVEKRVGPSPFGEALTEEAQRQAAAIPHPYHPLTGQPLAHPYASPAFGENPWDGPLPGITQAMQVFAGLAPVGLQKVKTPIKASEAFERIEHMEGNDTTGEFEILEHVSPNGARSWSVVIKGTAQWMPGGTNPQDIETNLADISGFDSDQKRAILAGMEAVGIGEGEPVEFIGHSQGGIEAGGIATDPEVLDKYTVVSVMTAGSPVAFTPGNTNVRVLSLENTRDIVPALDGEHNARVDGQVTVHFDGDKLGLKNEKGEPAGAHDVPVYTEAMSEIEAAGARPGLEEVREWEEHRVQAMGIGVGTTTTVHTVQTQRMAAQTQRVVPQPIGTEKTGQAGGQGKTRPKMETHPQRSLPESPDGPQHR
ncbi:MAG: hypothetical protein Q4C87_11500 [Actinomycetaceae bacterium]|nr:hypothetical protein [Actinomycetaceae bacterium]